jgi:DNA repair protein RadA/Sms
MAGEVGLSGEIRPVGRLEQRIQEAERLGMTNMLIPRNNLKGIDVTRFKIKLHEVAKVDEAFRALFG